ncbi:PLG [Branchiostoma lanceolatum]|uniref:PLG protein n=1 Tax=Branchiostoma lanceolatum TaxID=7740 RepID=A0A8J9Z0S0_BRALA|nr:PLG [Branchiostoma lanceolatum]
MDTLLTVVSANVWLLLVSTVNLGASAACTNGGTYTTSSSATITTDNYPSFYPKSSCTWSLEVPSGSFILLKFSSFDIEEFGNCAFENVIIYDGNTNGTKLGQFCGTILPPALLSTSNTMTVVLSTFGFSNTEYTGFSASFTEKGSDCQRGDGASYRGTVSVTATGNTCQRWDSQTPQAHYGFNTPEANPSSGLEQNYCRNPDGASGVWCYDADNSTRWEYCDVPVCDLDSGCYNLASWTGAATGTISSMYYGTNSNYEDNASCKWEITVTSGKYVTLTFHRTFRVDPFCIGDKVKVYSGVINGLTELGSFCGTTTPSTVQSCSNKMTVEFTTDSANAYHGFLASFSESGTCLPLHGLCCRDYVDDLNCWKNVSCRYDDIFSYNIPSHYTCTNGANNSSNAVIYATDNDVNNNYTAVIYVTYNINNNSNAAIYVTCNDVNNNYTAVIYDTYNINNNYTAAIYVTCNDVYSSQCVTYTPNYYNSNYATCNDTDQQWTSGVYIHYNVCTDHNVGWGCTFYNRHNYPDTCSVDWSSGDNATADIISYNKCSDCISSICSICEYNGYNCAGYSNYRRTIWDESDDDEMFLPHLTHTDVPVGKSADRYLLLDVGETSCIPRRSVTDVRNVGTEQGSHTTSVVDKRKGTRENQTCSRATM